MPNQEHVERLLSGVENWNSWRSNVPDLPDLSWADLSRANLHQANLRAADLRGTDLRGADVSLAQLSQANLSEANLRGADLSEANLSGATLRGAEVGWTVFGDVDLSTVLALDTLQHGAPSTIGIDTIYRSGGKIPHIFLRGAGVPDNFIEYMASLAGRAIDFYSCFISYCSSDEQFARKLHADLRDKGVRCWFAPEDMRHPHKMHVQIDEAIRVHDRLLLILSRDSMNSRWVQSEIAKARQREVREKRQMLFPLRLVDLEVIRAWECFDSDIGNDSAREIREFFIADFSSWQDHDSYQKAFKRLLRDLKNPGADQA